MKRMVLLLLVIGVSVQVHAASVHRQLWGHEPFINLGAGLTFTTIAANSATYRLGWTFQAQSTEAITNVTTCSASVTGTTARYKVSVQTVDGNGLPSGILGGGSPASLDSIVSSTWGTDVCVNHALTNPTPALTAGTVYAVVVEAGTGGTNDASNLVTFKASLPSLRGTSGFPYTLNDADGAWTTADKTVNAPVFGANGSTVHYGQAITANSASVYSATTETGVRVVTEAGIGSAVQIAGVRWIGRGPAAGNTIYITVYSGGDASSPTVLVTKSIDGDYLSTAATNRSINEYYFDAPVAITPGVVYHIGLSASGGSPDINYLDYFSSNDFMGGTFGMGSMTFVTRTIAAAPPVGESNAFAETATRKPLFSLIISDIISGGGVIGG